MKHKITVSREFFEQLRKGRTKLRNCHCALYVELHDVFLFEVWKKPLYNIEQEIICKLDDDQYTFKTISIGGKPQVMEIRKK